ncbi:MAG: selenide, water dikinase SelD [Oligoflexia bacterium]|nr:selenide, water dikinase SelD [Oligoflexia bacterium]
MNKNNCKYKLTEFSPGAGCGCKISPKELEQILSGANAKTSQNTNGKYIKFPNLLVGNESKDDAAVYDLGNGEALISTTDFFTPIVDDPFDFGRIAATNAISDIYAMGGKPTLAIAILGWPLSKLPVEVASEVVAGARTVCDLANIPLAGGHSIDIADPIFGLAVNGLIKTKNIKRNDRAIAGCKLLLTKPLGVGIITTAQKRSLASVDDVKLAIEQMTTLNNIGSELSELSCVRAMTDVTGFGLLGHLLEMCEGSNVNAIVDFKKVPIIKSIEKYLELKTIPGGTKRNWNSYGHKITKDISEVQKNILCDPQTSGGLLIAVDDGDNEFKQILQILKQYNLCIDICEFGRLEERKNEDEVYIKVTDQVPGKF